jgi:hypothetical protein
MTEKRYMPEPNRLSILTATVLLAFALTRVVSAPSIPVYLPLGRIYFGFSLNLNTLIVVLAAGLTAAGMGWLLETHPSIQEGEVHEHWLLPTLTVLVTGIALYSLPHTVVWWLGFGLGAAILVTVFMAEYVAVDSGDARYPIATLVLSVMAYIIFFILAVALRASDGRLVVEAPAVFLGGGLAALRILHLRLNERWEPWWAFGIAVVIMQLEAGLHYLPLTPVRFGLCLLGPLYALTSLAVGLIEGQPMRRAVAEPLVMLALLWGLMIWFH